MGFAIAGSSLRLSACSGESESLDVEDGGLDTSCPKSAPPSATQQMDVEDGGLDTSRPTSAPPFGDSANGSDDFFGSMASWLDGQGRLKKHEPSQARWAEFSKEVPLHVSDFVAIRRLRSGVRVA